MRPRNFDADRVCWKRDKIGDEGIFGGCEWLTIVRPRRQHRRSRTPAGARTVMCVKFGRKMEGLDRVPWKGELGQRVYENVSKEAWKMWIEHSKMIMNEYRLNPLDPQSQKIMEEQLEQFFFGEGAKLPEGFVPQRAKGYRPGLLSLASLS